MQTQFDHMIGVFRSDLYSCFIFKCLFDCQSEATVNNILYVVGNGFNFQNMIFFCNIFSYYFNFLFIL